MNKKNKKPMPGQDISDRIKLRMDELGLSRDMLVNRLGLSEAGVKKILGGGSAVQWIKLGKLAEILDTTPNYLLGIDGDHSVNAKRSRTILGAAIEAALQTLGNLKQEHAQRLAQAILSIPDKPAIVSAGLDEETSARTRAEIAAQEYLPPKN